MYNGLGFFDGVSFIGYCVFSPVLNVVPSDNTLPRGIVESETVKQPFCLHFVPPSTDPLHVDFR